MQKSEFLQKLSDLLIGSELDRETADQAVQAFSEYLDTLPDGALHKELNELTDVSRVAQMIVSKHNIQSREAIDTVHQTPKAVSEPVRANNGTKSHPDRTQKQIPLPADDDLISTNETIKIDIIPPQQRTNGQRAADAAQTAAIPTVPQNTAPSQVPPNPSRQVQQLQQSRAIKYADLDRMVAVDPKNRIIFWCVALLLSPVILALVAAVMVVFLGVFLAMSVVIAACIASLIGVVGVGTGVTLFGLIYGTTQLFSTVSAGLYEIGIAVTVAGGALFIGIVLYNTAIRLMPFLMKYLYIFFLFVMRKGYQLFQFIRRECTGR